MGDPLPLSQTREEGSLVLLATLQATWDLCTPGVTHGEEAVSVRGCRGLYMGSRRAEGVRVP